MATSELGYYARFDESLVGANDFADAGMSRRAINNLNHLADQRGQVLIDWVPDSQASDYASVYASSPVAGDYYELWRSTTFDLSVQASGESYHCRSRLYITSNTGSYQAAFKAVLCWSGRDPVVELNRAGGNVQSVNVTSASYSWQAPSSLLYLTADQVSQATTTVATINSVGGAVLSATVVEAQLVVFATVVDASASARLGGLYLAAYHPV